MRSRRRQPGRPRHQLRAWRYFRTCASPLVIFFRNLASRVLLMRADGHLLGLWSSLSGSRRALWLLRPRPSHAAWPLLPLGLRELSRRQCLAGGCPILRLLRFPLPLARACAAAGARPPQASRGLSGGPRLRRRVGRSAPTAAPSFAGCGGRGCPLALYSAASWPWPPFPRPASCAPRCRRWCPAVVRLRVPAPAAAAPSPAPAAGCAREGRGGGRAQSRAIAPEAAAATALGGATPRPNPPAPRAARARVPGARRRGVRAGGGGGGRARARTQTSFTANLIGV